MHYKVSVVKTFSAAHALRGYQGRCEHLHGHNWKIRAAVTGTRLNKIGMVMDFTELKRMLDEILARLDHRYLNEVPPFATINPTAENIAAFLFNELKKSLPKGVKVGEIEVWESETSSALVTE